MPEERTDEHIEATDIALMEAEINAALEGSPLLLDHIFNYRSEYYAVLIYRVNQYQKGFNSPPYQFLSDLRQAVIDLLPLVTQEEIDVNIFSSDIFEYLAAEMLPKDKNISMTIKAVYQDEVAGPRGTQTKVIITFVERPKKFILNKTNARQLAAALGPETDDWKGASVLMGVEMVKVGREMVPSIRVRNATLAANRSRIAKANEPADEPQDDLFGEPAAVTNGAYTD